MCNRALKPGGKQKRGKKPLLNSDSVKLLRDRVAEQCLELNSPDGWDAGDAIFRQVLREVAPNKIANPVCTVFDNFPVLVCG